MPSDAYQRALAALSGFGPLRVWSVLVTVFGDLAPRHGIDGPVLSALMNEIGIKPEATRVALHRLRSDGWIVSQKQGRNSVHSLSPKGQADSDAARPRIYGNPPLPEDLTLIVLPPDGRAPDPRAYAKVAPRVFLAPNSDDVPEGALTTALPELASWLGAHIETDSLVQGYACLCAVLHVVDHELGDTRVLEPVHVAVLRVLIVHGWRRLALRHPCLPRAAHTADWRGHDAQNLVAQLLDRFERPALDQIILT